MRIPTRKSDYIHDVLSISYRQADWGDFKKDYDRENPKYVVYLGWPASGDEERWWWDTDDEASEKEIDKIIQGDNASKWDFSVVEGRKPTDDMTPLIVTLLTSLRDNGYDASSQMQTSPAPDFGKRYYKITFRKRK